MRKLFTLIVVLAAFLSAQTIPGRVWSEFKVNEVNTGIGLSASSFFGSAVANIGDFNNDGVEDFVTGAEGYNNSSGACWLLLMNADFTVKNKIMVAPSQPLAAEDYFGCAVTGIGDFNSDGVKDIAVGARGDDTGGNNYGALYLLCLNANGSLKTSIKVSSATTGFSGSDFSASDNFGCSLAFLDDYNNDTYKELVVGACGREVFKGSFWLLTLKTDGTIHAKNNVRSTTVTDLANFDAFGSSIAVLNDLDGDNIKDLAVGAPLGEDGTDKGTGAVYFMRLNNNLTVKSFTKISKSSPELTSVLKNLDQLGNSLCAIGDIDKNGYQDLAAGLYQCDDGAKGAGGVCVLLLGANGVLSKVEKISSTNGGLGYSIPAGTQFGSALAAVADWDNNGVPGFVCGMQNFNGNAINQGGLDFINLYGNARTDSVSNNDGTSIKAWGTVNPYGLTTTVVIEYGLTTAYGSLSQDSIITGSSDKIVGIKLNGLQLATTYHYRVHALNTRGYTRGKDKTFTTATASNISLDLIPTETNLHNNYPNPFNPATRINYDLAADNPVKLAVYNAKGELVQTLVNSIQTAGRYSVEFDGRNLNSGVYFYKLETAGKCLVNKMVLCK